MRFVAERRKLINSQIDAEILAKKAEKAKQKPPPFTGTGCGVKEWPGRLTAFVTFDGVEPGAHQSAAGVDHGGRASC